MASYDSNPTLGSPEFSIVIAVYNAWDLLADCLSSLSEQTNAPVFEVIVVDDGSQSPAPETIRRWSSKYPLTIIRDAHAGIPAARNRGIQSSSGSVVLFTDADCRFQANCLSALAATIANSPGHKCFQLHLIGDRSTLAGRAEELRLIEIQKQTMQPNGTIRYLNTAGFAIRRVGIATQGSLFNPAALRSEDTLLLVDLIERGDLPFFVAEAVVKHSICMPLLKCFRKDFRAALLEARTFEIIAAKGVPVRMSHRERISMLVSMWKTARRDSIGRTAWLLLLARQSLQRTVTAGYRLLCSRRIGRAPVNSS